MQQLPSGFTPPLASWVEQEVELFFSILQRTLIRNGDFASCGRRLIDTVLRFIADDDQPAQRFKWTYAADPFVA